MHAASPSAGAAPAAVAAVLLLLLACASTLSGESMLHGARETMECVNVGHFFMMFTNFPCVIALSLCCLFVPLCEHRRGSSVALSSRSVHHSTIFSNIHVCAEVPARQQHCLCGADNTTRTTPSHFVCAVDQRRPEHNTTICGASGMIVQGVQGVYSMRDWWMVTKKLFVHNRFSFCVLVVREVFLCHDRKMNVMSPSLQLACKLHAS